MKIKVINAKKEAKLKEEFKIYLQNNNISSFEDIQKEWRKLDTLFCVQCGKTFLQKPNLDTDTILVCSVECKTKLSESSKKDLKIKKRKESKEAQSLRMKNLREARKKAGLIKVEVWIKPDDREKVTAFDLSHTVKK